MPARTRPGLIVVADDEDLRLLLRLILRRDPRLHVLDDAATADEALDQVAARRPDLIILDEHIAGVDGVDLAPDLLAAAPRAMVLLLAPPFSAPTVRSIAVDGLLPKDRITELPALVAALLELEAAAES